MTQIEALYVALTINNEGFRYGLESKTSFPAIKDPIFQGLRKNYSNGVKGTGPKIKDLILKTAGLKNFKYDHIVFVLNKNYTMTQQFAEDKRWGKAQEADTAKWLALMRAELEPNNIMKGLLKKK